MEVQVAVAKVAKYATGESGDTVEMIERPHGGLSFVLVDGQRSGRSAKAISNLVARKAISLLAEGVRDGAAARAAHDYLYTHRGGKVLATLNVLSVDLVSRTIVLSRNSHCPILIVTDEGLRIFDEPSRPVGVYRGTKPLVVELPLQAATTVVLFTDGLLDAGKRTGQALDIPATVQSLCDTGGCDAQAIADQLLTQALQLDEGRASDDITVLVLTVRACSPDDTFAALSAANVRRMSVTFPLS
ncbi:MAG: serine/threonine-protein phosphatase [Anaerolineales bacterium]|nr:MAG: serine/threonine-protein phosphatase [Anaerolineales bacterium]